MNKLFLVLFWSSILCYSTALSADTFENDFVAAATERTQHSVTYDGTYHSINYPNGDVPSDRGVCTDVIIRSYRGIGVDLQQLVHEDMQKNFNQYPSKRIWGLSKTDSNIDHRRVPNLQAFFKRHGEELIVSSDQNMYTPGDLVTWMLPGNLPHIGIVSDKINSRTGDPLIIHNIGAGPKLNDILFKYKITGHYKFVPKSYKNQLTSASP